MKKLLLLLFLIPNFLFAKEQCENMQQPPQEFMGMELITFKKYDDPKMGVGFEVLELYAESVDKGYFVIPEIYKWIEND